ncbi:MAG: TonB-dependent receptor [Cyclobacteriaceae bacterium]
MNRLLAYIILLGSVTSLSAQNSSVLITESYQQISLKTVLTDLSDRYQLKIAYSDDLIADVKVTVQLEEDSLSSAFAKILNGTGFTFDLILPATILIKERTGPELLPLKSMMGSVEDAESGERLPFVYFYQPLEALSTSSNEDGYFTLSDLSTNSKIVVSYIGYQDTTILAADLWHDARISLKLRPSMFKLDEVIVSNSKTKVFASTGNLSSIAMSPAFAKSIPAAGESDVFRMMQLLPGVASTNELSSGLAVNGGTATQNLVIFDGIPIYHVDHFFGYFSAINPNAIKSINLYKGGFEAKYGGRSSSLVNIVGNDGNGEEVSGQISFNELSANTSLAVPISDKSRLFLSGRRSYTDVLETSLFESIFSLYESDLQSDVNPVRVLEQEYKPEFYYTDLSFKFSTDLSDRDLLEVSFYDSNDILNFTEDYTVRIGRDTTLDVKNVGFINWGNIGSSVKYSRLWNADHYSNVLLSFSNYASEYQEIGSVVSTDAESSRATEQDNMIRDVSFKIDHEWRIGTRKLETGLQFSNFKTSINSLLNDSSITDIDQENIFQLMHYAQYPIVKNEQLTVLAGLRSNYLSSTGLFYSEPRINFSLKLTDRIYAHGAAGVYRQFVNQIQTENALQGSRDLWLISDENIADQRSNHFMLGAEYFRNGLSFSANYFHKTFDGLLDYAFSRGGLVTPYEDYERLFFQGESKARGLEFLLKKESNNLTAWASYTLSESLTRYPELNNNSYFPSDNDQRHEVTLFGSYKLDKWTFFTTWYYGSGMPFTTYSLREIQKRDNSKVTKIRPDGQNTGRLPEYHRLDVGLTYDWNFELTRLQVSGKISNFYNRENVMDQRLEIIRPPKRNNGANTLPRLVPYDLKLMGFTPSFSVNFKF